MAVFAGESFHVSASLGYFDLLMLLPLLLLRCLDKVGLPISDFLVGQSSMQFEALTNLPRDLTWVREHSSLFAC